MDKPFWKSRKFQFKAVSVLTALFMFFVIQIAEYAGRPFDPATVTKMYEAIPYILLGGFALSGEHWITDLVSMWTGYQPKRGSMDDAGDLIDVLRTELLKILVDAGALQTVPGEPDA